MQANTRLARGAQAAFQNLMKSATQKPGWLLFCPKPSVPEPGPNLPENEVSRTQFLNILKIPSERENHDKE
jgi:hypothetical protein